MSYPHVLFKHLVYLENLDQPPIASPTSSFSGRYTGPSMTAGLWIDFEELLPNFPQHAQFLVAYNRGPDLSSNQEASGVSPRQVRPPRTSGVM